MPMCRSEHSQAQVKSRTVNESWEALMISDEAEKQAGS